MKSLIAIMMSGLILAGFSVSAQKKATIKFVSTEFDYGKIKEDGGSKTCRYDFTNTGNDTLKILNVKPGCGCITVDWTKTPIPPKGKGFLNATYDPKNRPGPFSKGIDVTTNDPDQPQITLVIRGEVEPRPKSVADDYPNQIGHLRFNSPQVTFQNINNTESKTDTLKLYNEWGQPMTLGFTKLPIYIKCKAIPEKLKPNSKGLLLVTYDAANRNDFGFIYDRFTFETNDSLQPEKQVSVSVNIIEDFSKMTPEQLANAAKIQFENTNYDFGTVNEGDKVEHDFVFTNTGKSDLYIRKVKGS
jgi:hypothetical protein